MASQNTLHELFRVDQVAGAEMLGGPLGAFLQLDAEEMATITEHAITHRADELSVPIINRHLRARQHGAFELQAYSGKGDVLQIGDPAAYHAPMVGPYRFDELRAKEPITCSPFLNAPHVLLIGFSRCG